MGACEHCGAEHESRHRFCPVNGELMASRLLPEGELLEGKYRICRTIGVGGMGAVFEATHILLDKQVAIKVVLPGSGDESNNLSSRLVREARAASATGHKNITMVTDMGHSSDGMLFVVMEYLEGKTIKEILVDEGVLSIPRATTLIVQVLSGLETVHRNGIVHRDLKPENLMLIKDDEGEDLVKILDFGISKILTSGDQAELTTTGLVMGTPRYMSPEQACGKSNIDHRADLFSAGAIYYRMITGSPPHRQETLNALIAATITGEIDPPSHRNPDLPPTLDPVVLKAMAREPEDRYPEAQSFGMALIPFLTGDIAVPGRAAASASTRSVVSAAGPASDSASRPTRREVPSVAPLTGPAGPPSQSVMPDNLDASSLVALDEMTPSPRPEPKKPVVKTPYSDDSPTADEDLRFQPPAEDEEMSLELDPLASAHEAARQKAPRPPSREISRPDHPSSKATPGYGQARKKQGPGRTILIAVLAAAVCGGVIWKLFLDDGVAQPTAAPKLQENVKINITVFPSFATLTVDGVTISSQPLILARSTQEYWVRATARGFSSQLISIQPDKDQTVHIQLKPRPGHKTRPGPGREKRGK